MIIFRVIKVLAFLSLALTMLNTSFVYASPEVISLRSNSFEEKVQLVLDMSAPPRVNFKLYQRPIRLILDVDAIPSKTYRNLLSFKNRGILRLNTKMLDRDTIRMSIELTNQFPYKVYSLSKATNKNDRIVIDIYDKAKDPLAVQRKILQSQRKNIVHNQLGGEINPNKNYRVINATDLIANAPRVSAINRDNLQNSAKVIKAQGTKVKLKETHLPKVSLTSTKVIKAPISSKVKTATNTIHTEPKWEKQTAKITQQPKSAKKVALIIPNAKKITRKKMLVVIDPGHGGKDGGAVGAHGTREKDVVLQIAKRLKKHIDAQPNMRAILTRNNDRYIPLRGRTKFAREKNADLFISIHADAFTRRDVQGSSVFILSTRGASSEAARQLAKRENAVDLKYGVDFKNYDPDISKVLMDIQQSATIESSYVLARKTLGQLKGVGKVHKRYVERAGFAVLKSPDIPSMLVETAFISNPGEEKKLKSSAYQERLAKAIASGVKRYFAENLPHHILLGQANN